MQDLLRLRDIYAFYRSILIGHGTTESFENGKALDNCELAYGRSRSRRQSLHVEPAGAGELLPHRKEEQAVGR